MDYQSRLSISFYREIAVINEEHKIYLVQHLETGKIYVKKILDVYNSQVYRQLLSLPITGIPKIHALYEENATLTVIEEYISGETLQEILDKCGAISENEVAKYILQLCDILSRLHSLNIIHRDIKPSNIIINQSGQVFLIDLNAAKYTDSLKKEDTVLLGTNGFAAPEQYGFGSSNIQTDIYAIGILINTLLTGSATNQQISNGHFKQIIQKSTQLRPSDRFQTTAALKKAIENLNLYKEIPVYANSKPFLPPGYRTGNASHMILATLGYAFTIMIGLSMEIKNSTPSTLWIERISFIIIAFAIIFFTCNYKDVQHFFPLCSSKKIVVRIAGILIFDILIFLILIIFMMIIESVFLSVT
ncbi:MAG: serine/threonine protein kinase [Lachnospiraceae bacterium]|nr:serine/threonine protein kinase [Lachnospiraceae bacterium]